jgi:hypothetical protein
MIASNEYSQARISDVRPQDIVGENILAAPDADDADALMPGIFI